MSATVGTKVRCRQDALCAREHSYCDICGRYVHGVTVRNSGYEHEENLAFCFLCDGDTKWAAEQRNDRITDQDFRRN